MTLVSFYNEIKNFKCQLCEDLGRHTQNQGAVGSLGYAMSEHDR